MNELHNLPNIGAYIETKLYDVHIHDEKTLRELGSKAAFKQMLTADDTLCIRVLYSLEGAIQGIKDSALSAADKEDLKAYFKMITK